MKKILETERLFLREMSMDDFDAYIRIVLHDLPVSQNLIISIEIVHAHLEEK